MANVHCSHTAAVWLINPFKICRGYDDVSEEIFFESDLTGHSLKLYKRGVRLLSELSE